MINEIKANQLIQDPHGASLELWQIEEMTTPGIVGTVRDIWGKNQGQPEWCQVPSVNEQWTQHVSPPRRFICIGAREVVILHRLQPWEKMRALASEELGARRGQSFEQPDDLPLEQKCASLLLWWVRAGGSPGGAKPEGSRLSQADHASRFLFRLASQHEGRVSGAGTACGRVRAVRLAQSCAVAHVGGATVGRVLIFEMERSMSCSHTRAATLCSGASLCRQR